MRTEYMLTVNGQTGYHDTYPAESWEKARAFIKGTHGGAVLFARDAYPAGYDTSSLGLIRLKDGGAVTPWRVVASLGGPH